MEEIFLRKKCKDENDWLEKRKNGIGGSSCSAILGQNPYKTNVDYFREKVGKLKQPSIKNNPALHYGSVAEEYIRGMFILDYESIFEVYHQEYELLIRKDKPFIRSSLDGEIFVIEDCIVDGVELKQGMRGILEIKTFESQSQVRNLKWKDGNIPQNYHCQRIHYLMTTGYDFHILRCDFRKYSYKFNIHTHYTQDYCILREDVKDQINYLEDKETVFWKEHVLKNNEPNLILPSID